MLTKRWWMLMVAAAAACTDTGVASETVGSSGSADTTESTTTTESTPADPTTTDSPSTDSPTESTPTGAAMVCGDGVIDADEQCDDGADNGPDQACSSACTLPNCGDGVVDEGEGCDNGANNGDTNVCTASCSVWRCGDGLVGPGEGCDDGNAVDDDECSNTCALTSCGDGLVNAFEACDDGDADDADACTSNCTLAACGDGFVQPSNQETCDDGAGNADDAACTTACLVAACGDGHVLADSAEQCDDGADNGPMQHCNAMCLENVCGDGDRSPLEGCDDGNAVADDGCSPECTLEFCGSGVVDPGEGCDDGMDGSEDECTDACQLPVCGDGFVQPGIGEQCDLAAMNSASGVCTPDCQDAACGDGFVQDLLEQCDDGANNGPMKACNAACETNVCGDGDPGPLEGCDDGNQSNEDDCTNVCKPASCGDGFVQQGEQCDDGNLVQGDACINTCVSAKCGDGITYVGTEVCDDGNIVETDACLGTCVAAKCGDGFVHEDVEQCDDGNNASADICSSTCKAQEVLKLAHGGSFGCAIVSGGIVKCWGNGAEGKLGIGSTATIGDSPVEMGAALMFTNLGMYQQSFGIAAGVSHACAVLAEGKVKCWGSGDFGGLGQATGSTNDRGDSPNEMGNALAYTDLGTDITASSLHASENFTCALVNGGRVKCWGHNQFGQLGLGDATDRGTGGSSMGDNLPFVDLGPGLTATALALGTGHACALLTGGGIKCWGWNVSGQLGYGDTVDRGNTVGQMGANLPTVALAGPATAVSAGHAQTCALLANGRVQCWGNNIYGELGLGDTQNRGDAANEMGPNLPPVDLGPGKLAIAVSAGGARTCAQLGDNTIKCWGRGNDGDLGLGDTTNRGDDPGEMGNALPTVDLGAGVTATFITAGAKANPCAILSNGAAKCWGGNASAELGLGDTASRGDNPGEMGDALPRIRLFSSQW